MYIDRIKTNNLLEDTRKAVWSFVEKLKEKNEVVGIVFLGGLAQTGCRRFIDYYSDIDLTIFLDIPQAEGYISSKKFARENQEILPRWLPEFQFDIQVNGEWKEVNCHQLIIQIESNINRPWDESKKEAYLYDSEILYDDVEQTIKKLIESKCQWNEEESRKNLITVLSQIGWYGWINPFIQYNRGFPWHSHMLLNNAIELVIQAFYILHKKYRPHMKWRFEEAIDFIDEIEDFDNLVKDFLLIKNYSLEDIERRSDVIRKLYDVLEKEAVSEGFIERGMDPFYYASVYLDEERQLLHHTASDYFIKEHQELSSEVLKKCTSDINFNLNEIKEIH